MAQTAPLLTASVQPGSAILTAAAPATATN